MTVPFNVEMLNSRVSEMRYSRGYYNSVRDSEYEGREYKGINDR